MNEPSPLSHSVTTAPPTDQGRWLRYLAIATLANLTIWGTAFYLLRGSPRLYTSQWSIILVKAERANVTVSNGGVTAQPADAGAAISPDARANYKVIATTDAVRRAAATKVGMTREQFGVPDIHVVDGTALMTFEITGSTPEEAQKKGYALNEALRERLAQLRLQQGAEQEAGFQQSLSVVRKNLETAQQRLSKYKVNSGLVSSGQIDQLATNIEALRRMRAEVMAQQRDATARARQLIDTLKISSPAAADAFVLRSDPLFQTYVQNYSSATAQLSALTAQFGPNHPVVVQEAAKQAAAERALQDRGQAILGQPLDPGAIARLSLSATSDAGTARETLFQQIIANEAERQGLTARARELDRQLYELEQRLSVLAQRGSGLEALNREMQISEAVFSSALTNLNNNEIDIFGSYPPIQMVAEPSLPTTAIQPQRAIFLQLAVVASVITTLAILLLWLRKVPLIQFWLRRFKPHPHLASLRD